MYEKAYSILWRHETWKRSGQGESIDGSFHMENLYGQDCVCGNPENGESKATKTGAFVGDRGILSALQRHCDNAHDDQIAVPTIQIAHILLRN